VRIIIVGGGEIGFALAKSLAEQHEVVVIDHAPSVGDRFEALDVQFLLGTGTSSELLGRAGIERAEILIACTGLDEVNIVACAVGNRLGSPRTYCFVARQEFLHFEGDSRSLEQFGVDRIVWPEAQLAEDIERIISVPDAIDAEVFADGAIRLLEYRIDGRSAIVDRRIADLHLPHGSLIVAVRRAESFFIPRGDSVLAAGDKAIVMGTPDALSQVQRHITGRADVRRQRVTIVGGGDVGLRLAERLDGAAGVDVTVIERDVARGEMLASRLRHSLVLSGDGTDLELLEAEDIGRSDVLVSVIDNDERNLLASLLGRQLGVKRIITRVGRLARSRS
jgi:trk system potassium uptake protein